jgi:hypothetical protein
MSARSSLLGAIVAMSVFCPLLLSYHCSDESVARDHSDLQSIATVPIGSSTWSLYYRHYERISSGVPSAGGASVSCCLAQYSCHRWDTPSSQAFDGAIPWRLCHAASCQDPTRPYRSHHLDVPVDALSSACSMLQEEYNF